MLSMQTKAKRWLVGLVILLVAGIVVLNVLAYNHAHAMMHFTTGGARTKKPEDLSFLTKLKVLLVGVNVPRPTRSRTPSELTPDCRDLSIRSPDDVVLNAWYCNQGDGTPLVILFHGYAADKTWLLRETRAFLELEASVLLVDFRGSGGSSESYTTVGVREAEDVAMVVRHARDSPRHPSLILFGQSMGAAAVLRAVHEHGVSPDAVIIEAVFDTMLNTVRNRFDTMRVPSFPSAQLLVFWGGRQWGFNGFGHNPVDYAKSLSCPSLFMHGTDDPRATLAEGRRVFEAASGPKTFKEFDAVGHEPYVSKYPDEWRTAVAAIIEKVENPE